MHGYLKFSENNIRFPTTNVLLFLTDTLIKQLQQIAVFIHRLTFGAAFSCFYIMDWFENWFGSPWYKLLYEHRDDQEAQDFVENLLSHLNPATGSRMLDIACGEGRFARQLASHGFDVTGIDLSSASIEAANAFSQDNLHFFVQDMRLPFYINYFDYAFNFFTSFGYFEHDRDHAAAARAFAAALKPGGTLVIDYFNATKVINSLVPQESIIRSGITFHINRTVENNHIIKQISFVDQDAQPHTFRESVAAFTLQHFENMLQAAGMQLTATFGNYALAPFAQQESPRLIMVFQKKHTQ